MEFMYEQQRGLVHAMAVHVSEHIVREKIIYQVQQPLTIADFFSFAVVSQGTHANGHCR